MHRTRASRTAEHAARARDASLHETFARDRDPSRPRHRRDFPPKQVQWTLSSFSTACTSNALVAPFACLSFVVSIDRTMRLANQSHVRAVPERTRRVLAGPHDIRDELAMLRACGIGANVCRIEFEWR
jgi:hypothetical protein